MPLGMEAEGRRRQVELLSPRAGNPGAHREQPDWLHREERDDVHERLFGDELELGRQE